MYFHNHGDPGPGIYLPEGWETNRARWRAQGVTLPDVAAARTLEPLPPEGLYRVTEAFHCCEKACVTFDPDLLVQLGYDGKGRAILFVPEWTEQGLGFPSHGQGIEADRLSRLAPLRVPRTRPAPPGDTGPAIH